MNPCAASAMALRPIDRGPPLIVSEPPGAKNEATLAASWPCQAAVYRAANSLQLGHLVLRHEVL